MYRVHFYAMDKYLPNVPFSAFCSTRTLAKVKIDNGTEKYIASGDPLSAANLYEEIKEYRISSQLYHDAGFHNDAANALQRGQLFNELLDYMSE